MAYVPIFTGRISDAGVLELARAEGRLRREWLKSLRGKDVEVIVRKLPTKRSLAQNNWIHAVASILAEETGYSLAEMKLYLMGECWGWKTLPNGREVPVKIHTADMSVEEAAQFTDWLIQWSSEHFPDVHIPLPGQVAA